MQRTRTLASAVAVLGIVAIGLVLPVGGSPDAAADVAPINPVRVDLNGHPANSGFLVFVEGDVALNADESEGTLALGGDLSFNSSYNVQAGAAPVFPTFTAPGDSGYTSLYVGGGITWPATDPVLKVLGGGFSKIADTTTYEAENEDQNGATVNYQVFEPSAGYGSQPRIEGTTSAQNAVSIAEPVPDNLIDIDGAFTQYRQITTELAGCPATVQLAGPDSPFPPLTPGWGAGTRGRLTLTAGQTNVLTISAADLNNLAEITFVDAPSADTPLLVNVTGPSFIGSFPNQAGISGLQAPYILWNFPDAQTIVVDGGDSLEGTIYAPNANLNWIPTANIEGNAIAKSFTHGAVAIGSGTGLREVHDLPFNTELSCTTDTTTTPTTETTGTTETTTTAPTTETTTTTETTETGPTTETSATTGTSATSTSDTTISDTTTATTDSTSSESTTGHTTTSELSTTGDTGETEVIATSTGPTLSNTGTPVTRLIPVGVVLALLGSALVVGTAVIRPKRRH